MSNTCRTPFLAEKWPSESVFPIKSMPEKLPKCWQFSGRVFDRKLDQGASVQHLTISSRPRKIRAIHVFRPSSPMSSGFGALRLSPLPFRRGSRKRPRAPAKGDGRRLAAPRPRLLDFRESKRLRAFRGFCLTFTGFQRMRAGLPSKIAPQNKTTRNPNTPSPTASPEPLEASKHPDII